MSKSSDIQKINFILFNTLLLSCETPNFSCLEPDGRTTTNYPVLSLRYISVPISHVHLDLTRPVFFPVSTTEILYAFPCQSKLNYPYIIEEKLLLKGKIWLKNIYNIPILINITK
jgi:hypothetical protein